LFSDRFDMLISKIKKYHFDAILSKKKTLWTATATIGEQKNRKTRTVKKNPIKPIKILKKLTGSVRFYMPETEKTEPNPNWRKPSQTEKTDPNRKNRSKPVWTGFCPKNKPKLVGLNRFQFGFGFFLKIDLVIFFNKN
jgi:streptogramin lyase